MMDNLRVNGASEDRDRLHVSRLRRASVHSPCRIERDDSPQFIAFVERKLRASGVAKIVPDQNLLAEIYVGFEKGHRLQEAVEEALDEIDDDDFKAPKDLQRRVRKYLKEHPQERWNKAISAIVAERNR